MKYIAIFYGEPPVSGEFGPWDTRQQIEARQIEARSKTDASRIAKSLLGTSPQHQRLVQVIEDASNQQSEGLKGKHDGN